MANQKPVVSGQSNVSFNTNQTFNFTSLISASDPDGSVASYTFFDSTPGAGFLTLNGTHISGTSVTVSAANLGSVGYSTDSTAGSNQIVIDAIDNQGLSSNDFTMTINVVAPANQKPVVSGQSNVTFNTNQTFNFTSLISASDPDGSVVSYTFFDSTPGAGFLTLNGTQISGTSVTVSAANLGSVGYSTGSTAGSNQIVIDAIDNQGLSSNDFAMTINVVAPASNQKPVVSGQSNVTFNANQTFNFTSLISASDPDGSVASYTFFDSTPGAGFLTLNGTHISGTSVTVSAANLGLVGYNTGSTAGSNQIVIDAIDNLGLSSNDFTMTINVNAPAANQKPVVSGQSNVTFNTNQTFNFTSLISAGDPDGSVASYTFFDSTPGAGFLTLNGTQISGTSVTVSAANLGSVGYSTGSTAGSNQIVIDAIDNQGLSSSDFLMTINVTPAGANQAPVVSGAPSINVPTGAVIGASQLYTSATDPDGSVTKIRFWDSTPGTGHLALDGVQISGGFVDITLAQINRVTYVTGGGAGSNDIVIDAYDNLGLVSNDLAVRINVTAASGNQAPIVTGSSNLSFATNQTISGSQLYSTASDPDGSVATIRFWDSTPGTGHFALDGVPISGNFVDVTPAQINRVTYVTGPNAGTNDIVVDAIDDQARVSKDLSVHLSIGGGGNQAPAITGLSSLNFMTNQTIAGSQLYTGATDPDGSVAILRFWDSTAGTAGYLTLDGVRITNHVDVAPSQINRIAYVTGPNVGNNAIVINAIDNQGKSSNDLSVVINVTNNGSSSQNLYVLIDTSAAGSTPQMLVNASGPNPVDIFWNSLEALSYMSNDGDGYKKILSALRKLPADQLPEVLKDQDITAVKQLGFLGNVAENITTIHDVWDATNAGITAYKNGNIGDALWKGSTELLINLASGGVGGIAGDIAVGGAIVGLAAIGVAGLPAIAIAAGVGIAADVIVTGVAHSALETGLQQAGLDHPLDLSSLASGFYSPSSQQSPLLAPTGMALTSMVSANISAPTWTYNADTGQVTSLQATNPALWLKTAALLGLDDTGVTPDSQNLVGDTSGAATNDLLIGAAGSDFLNGKAGDDFLAGLSGNDTITGGSGNDTIDGGKGVDTAVFSGLRSAYTITHAGSSLQVSGPDGTDTLTNIEKLAFDDMTVGLALVPYDFNGDAKSDLLFFNNTSHGVAIWQMNGTQVVASPQIGAINAAAGWSYASTGDFNGDAKADLLFLNGVTKGVAIWQMDGPQITASPQIGTIDAAGGWSYSGTGDFNGDGKTDLLFFNSVTNGVAIWQMNGTQIAANSQVGTINDAGGWGYRATGDFNGDGKTDLLFLNSVTHGIAVWQMDGTQIAASPQIGTINDAGGWHFADVGDFNGDGKSDLLFLNVTTHGVAVWQMDGTQITASPQIGLINAAGGWQFDSLRDFNGDGKTDLLFQNTTTHGVAVWQMDGTQITASPQIGAINAAADWHLIG